MSKTKHFDSKSHTVGLNSDFDAELVPARSDPEPRVNGVTIGMVTMTENSPHNGEMHPDGDETLYLVSGRVKVTLEYEQDEIIVMKPGDGMIVPKGIWHRVDILEPSTIFYATPGPNGEYRALGGES